PAAPPRARAVARFAADRRLGLPIHRRYANGGRPRTPPARKNAVPYRRARDREAVRIQTRGPGARLAGTHFHRARMITPGGTRFQHKFFVSAMTTAVLALLVAGILMATTMRRQLDERIESTLVAQARLASDLLARGTPLSTVRDLDQEADRMGALIGARVTF